MSSHDKPYEFGIYINRLDNISGGGTRLHVDIVRKSDDGQSICNLSDMDFSHCETRLPKRHHGHTFAGLGMRPHVYARTDGKSFIGTEMQYFDLYSIDCRAATKMAATLKAWHKATKKWHEEYGVMSPANMIAVLAKFTGATFIVHKDNSGGKRGGFYNESDWNFMRVRTGVDLFDSLVAKEIDLAQPEPR